MPYTKEQLEELSRIVSNDAALGPFAGMIFNQVADLPSTVSQEQLIERYVKRALDVRLHIRSAAASRINLPKGTL